MKKFFVLLVLFIGLFADQQIIDTVNPTMTLKQAFSIVNANDTELYGFKDSIGKLDNIMRYDTLGLYHNNINLAEGFNYFIDSVQIGTGALLDSTDIALTNKNAYFQDSLVIGGITATERLTVYGNIDADTVKINGNQIASTDLEDGLNLPKLDQSNSFQGDINLNTGFNYKINGNQITSDNLANGSDLLDKTDAYNSINGDLNLASGYNYFLNGQNINTGGLSNIFYKNLNNNNSVNFNYTATVKDIQFNLRGNHGTEGNNSNSPILGFYGANGVSGPAIQKVKSGGFGKGDLIFWQHKDDNYTDLYEAMRIKWDGNVGIGVTAPTEKLDVNGSVRAAGYKSADGTLGISNVQAGITTKQGLVVGMSGTDPQKPPKASLFVGSDIPVTITAGTPETPSGFTIKDSLGFGYSAGRLTYLEATPIYVSIYGTISLTSSINNVTASVYFGKNGIIDTTTRVRRKIGTGADVGNIVCIGSFEMSQGDYLDLFLDSDINTTFTLTDGFFGLDYKGDQ